MNQRLMQSIQWVFAVSHPISFVCFDFGFGFCACIIFTIKNNKRGSEWNTIFCHSNNEVAGFKRLVLRHFLFSILFVLLLVLLLFCIIFLFQTMCLWMYDFFQLIEIWWEIDWWKMKLTHFMRKKSAKIYRHLGFFFAYSHKDYAFTESNTLCVHLFIRSSFSTQ